MSRHLWTTICDKTIGLVSLIAATPYLLLLAAVIGWEWWQDWRIHQRINASREDQL